MKKIIYLVGPRGCGKSSVGRKVAEFLTWSFSDTDAVVQAKAKCSIAAMVEDQGWEAFRKAESAALHFCTEDAKDFPLVVGTGGGMVLAEENRLYMREHGLVFFLQVPVPLLVQRLQANLQEEQRPSLTGQSLEEEVASVLAARLPLYESCAHIIVDAALPIAEVTEKIYTATLKHYGV